MSSAARLRGPRAVAVAVVVVLVAAALVSCSTRSPLAARAAAGRPVAGQLPTTTAPPAAPTRIAAAPWISHAGDGVWAPAGREVGGVPAVYVTTVHQAGLPVGIAWMDTSRLRIALYAGTSQPSGNWSNDGSVPERLWGSLVAALNSGFRLNESMGGWFVDGVTAVPLRVGAASLVIYRDGSATVGAWGQDVVRDPSVVAVRQNLSMLVEGDVATPAVSTLDPKQVWGPPYQNNVRTWRSALGVDGAGHLLYVAGPSMDPQTLAGAMVAAGAHAGPWNWTSTRCGRTSIPSRARVPRWSERNCCRSWRSRPTISCTRTGATSPRPSPDR